MTDSSPRDPFSADPGSSGSRAPGPDAGEPFSRLLKFLAAGGGSAGEAYESIRRRLIRFFQMRRQSDAEDLADRTLDRVMRKLGQEGAVRLESDPAAFVYGVARNILREHVSAAVRRSAAVRELAATSREPAGSVDGLEEHLECLERCLGTLSARSREMITAYYNGSRSEKIANRKALATRLGIAPNALWIRSHRVRLALESCIEACLADRNHRFDTASTRVPVSRDARDMRRGRP